jgi:NifB/MoaA-like Fe-S oxidoreductase
LCDTIHAEYGSDVRVYPIENHFFGETVTVTGLLTGRDLINQLKNVISEDILLLSGSCFKEDEDIMLDDTDVPTIEAELGVKCKIVRNDGYHFVQQFITHQGQCPAPWDEY